MKTVIKKRCHLCGTTHAIEVDQTHFKEWLAGVYVQDALPELSEDDRELLISGICGKCFDGLYLEDEE